MKQHLNTLYVTTPEAYLIKEGEAVAVRVDGKVTLRVPIQHLGGIVYFGYLGCSPAVMGMCAEKGVAISFLTEHGRFLARVHGFTPGNVLLRREQYRQADDERAACAVARNIVAAKLVNSRSVIMRALRDYPNGSGQANLELTARRLSDAANDARKATTLDELRGIEGDAGRQYFGIFNHLVTAQQQDFLFQTRSRRPPLDNINALLSFVYSMLAHDARSACEAVGLDPAVGFLHRDRPGRAGLALDLMEEFRAFLADRLVLSLVNRRQVQASGFVRAESGGVAMDESTRKTVIVALQKRKQAVIVHPFINEKTTVGLLIHLQARLLSRYLRGELDEYAPFIWR